MMNMNNWKDETYIESLMRFARIMANSRTINVVFRGDVDTCFMLCMQADQWGLSPDFVAANSFYDEYGRISQTGKLLKNVFMKSADVKSVESNYFGDWELVKNKYTTNHDGAPSPSWSKEVEPKLGLDLKVILVDGTEATERLTLAELDPDIRSHNPAWATKPYNQIYNHLIRTLAFGKLSHLVHGTDTTEAEDEQKAASVKRPSSVTKVKSTDQATTTNVEQQNDGTIEPPVAAHEKPTLSPRAQELIDNAQELIENLQSVLLDVDTKKECLSDYANECQEYASSESCTDEDKKAISSAYDKCLTVFNSADLKAA